jgi:hypothetical protein
MIAVRPPEWHGDLVDVHPFVAAIALEIDAHNLASRSGRQSARSSSRRVYGLLLGIFRGEHVAPRQLAADSATGFRASVLVIVNRQAYLHGVIPERAALSDVAHIVFLGPNTEIRVTSQK